VVRCGRYSGVTRGHLPLLSVFLAFDGALKADRP
jgi:hypothetical protein